MVYLPRCTININQHEDKYTSPMDPMALKFSTNLFFVSRLGGGRTLNLPFW